MRQDWRTGSQRSQEQSREQAGGGSASCLLFGGVKWEGGRGLTHTLTQCLSWQEEEMPCIFQPLVPRPSLNASPKNTAWKQSYANSSLLSPSPSAPPTHRFIFEWGLFVKGTWCSGNLIPLLSSLLPFRFLEGTRREGGKDDCLWVTGKAKGMEQRGTCHIGPFWKIQ